MFITTVTVSNRLICRIFLLCVTLLLIVQLPRANTSNNGYLIKQYTDEHGLPQNSIKGIGQDNLGFVWLITEKGPVRYDGDGLFRTFDDLSTKLKSDRMVALYRGSQPNEFWAQSEFNEMILLKDGKPTTSEKPLWGVLQKLRSIREKTLYHSVRLPPSYPDYTPQHLVVPDGAGGDFVISSDSISVFPPFHMSPTASIPFADANLWQFASLHGKLYYFEGIRQYTEINKEACVAKKNIGGDLSDLPNSTPFNLYWNPVSNQLFVYAANSLYRLAETEDGNLSSTLLLTGFDFRQHDIIAVHHLASEGQILLGSETDGLFVIQKRFFTPLTIDLPHANNVFYTQALLPNGSLLSDHGAIFDNDGTLKRALPLVGKKHQRGQIIGPGETIWILLKDTIMILSRDASRIVDIKPNPMQLKYIYKDDSARYWLGGEENLLAYYDASRDTFVVRASLPSTITYIERADDSVLFIGTRKGLFSYNTVSTTVTGIPAFGDMHIRSIRRESDGRHWVTTYQHGFFLYENGHITAFPLDKNRYLTTSHCTLEDDNGFIWISTNKGLFKVSKQQLLDYKKNNSETPFYFYYNKNWGFDSNEFNGGCMPCAIKLPDGRFSFPSLRGLVQFDPMTIIDEFPAGAIVVDEVRLNGNRLPIGDTIDIPRHFSRLDVKLATPFYGNLHSMEIEYLLDSKGRQVDEWLPINFPQNTLSINDLPSGNHALNIRMRNGPGPKDFQYASVHFYVQPLFHETWWFTAIFCMSIGLIFWLMIYIRTKLVLKQNRLLIQKVNERTEDLKKQYEWQQHLSASITHDIKAPLHYVVQTLHAMQSVAKAQRITSGEIQQIYHVTQHIYQYSNNLTNLSRIMRTKEWLVLRDVCLHQVVQSQVDIFLPIAKLRGNTITNEIPQDTVINAHADILSVIIHNILDNAIKFTKGGQITISVENMAAGLVSFSISDTGVGLRPEQVAYYNTNQHVPTNRNALEKETGFGLMLAKDVAQLINAEMHIRSVLGKGTTIVFALRQNHATGIYQSIP